MEADDGYVEEFPRKVKCTYGLTQTENTKCMQTLVHCWHKYINKQLKQFGALKQVFRHDIGLYDKVIQSIAAITQLSIKNEEPLFSVD